MKCTICFLPGMALVILAMLLGVGGAAQAWSTISADSAIVRLQQIAQQYKTNELIETRVSANMYTFDSAARRIDSMNYVLYTHGQKVLVGIDNEMSFLDNGRWRVLAYHNEKAMYVDSTNSGGSPSTLNPLGALLSSTFDNKYIYKERIITDSILQVSISSDSVFADWNSITISYNLRAKKVLRCEYILPFTGNEEELPAGSSVPPGYRLVLQFVYTGSSGGFDRLFSEERFFGKNANGLLIGAGNFAGYAVFWAPAEMGL